MTEWHVSCATRRDLDALAAMVNGAYRGPSARTGWTHEADLLDGQRTDVASLDDEISAPDPSTILLLRGSPDSPILACTMLQRYRDDGDVLKCHLAMLTVSPAVQAQGLGRLMLGHAEAWATDGGCRAIRMTVIPLRAELVAWYERRGYRRTGETKPFPHGDERFGLPRRDDLHFIVLEKPLG